MMKILFCFILFPVSVFSNELDTKLQQYIQDFRISSPKTVLVDDVLKYKFGKMLFADKRLSLANSISCKTCHDPNFGTSDALPFSIGVNGTGDGDRRVQQTAHTTPRNSPHLFNKGHESLPSMFWDGRVSYDKQLDSYQTPEPGLNGENPKFIEIVSKIENVLAMQALFPMTSVAEMRGEKHKSLTNREVWVKISLRIKNAKEYQHYIKPYSDFNIADIANALSYFQKIEFQVNNTPFDKYISGDINALSENEKKGAIAFFEVGRCARCHHGPLLTNNAFKNIGTPHIGMGDFVNDIGRGAISGRERDNYAFFTSPLRNIALTAPYMHNGAYLTLMEVVEHYDNVFNGLNNFDITKLWSQYDGNYNISPHVDHSLNIKREETIAAPVRAPLKLYEKEKKDLVCFMKRSLTEAKYHNLVDMAECL